MRTVRAVDPAGELLDIYDEQGAPAGVKPRGEVHLDGDWHRAFHCWVHAERASGGHLLFQRRAAGKQLWGGKLDVTVGGHVVAGETDEAGVREIAEELGAVVSFADLVHLGECPTVVRDGAMYDRERCVFYRYDDEREPWTWPCLNGGGDGELDGLVELPLTALAQLIRGQVASHRTIIYTAEGGEATVLTGESFAAHPDGYWESLLSWFGH